MVTGILDEAAKALRLAIFPGDGKRIELLRPSKKQSTVASTAAPDSPQGHDPKEASINTETPAKEQNDIAETVVTSESSRTESGSDFSEADAMTTLFYDQMLRSGQSINHVGGDLVLTDSVNNGAEAITDNSLHVYGRAQGRLVAGATGDKDARIFVSALIPR